MRPEYVLVVRLAASLRPELLEQFVRALHDEGLIEVVEQTNHA